MNTWTARALLLALVTTAACSTPPAQPQTQAMPEPAAAPVVEPAPKSDAIMRADALLEDLKRREAAQAKFDRENPPPALPVPSMIAAPAIGADAQPPSTAAAGSTPGAPTAGAVRDETWWKQQMQWLQLLLDEASAKLAEAEKANFKYGYNDAQAEYKKRADAVAEARLAIERLRDEARRAGVPPGWLR